MEIEAGKLVFRHEGLLWNAYYELAGVGAVLIGSVTLGLVDGRPMLRDGFMDLMTSIVCTLAQEATGRRATLGAPTPASDAERGGNA